MRVARISYKAVPIQGPWSNEPIHWDRETRTHVPGWARNYYDMFVFATVSFACNTDAVEFGTAWENNVACRLHLMGGRV